MGDEREWAALIARIDAAIHAESGQCALVIAAVRDNMIVGASAGDCGAWYVLNGIEDLTERQVRKPLVGSGSAVPLPFRKALGAGTLLLASDGLLKYARRKDIAQVAAQDALDAAARELGCRSSAPAKFRTTWPWFSARAGGLAHQPGFCGEVRPRPGVAAAQRSL